MSSTEERVLDDVFGLLAAGCYPCDSYNYSYTPGDKLKASQLPYAQAYGSVLEYSEDIYLQARGLTTFRLELVDVPANRDALRMGLQALSVELARNANLWPGAGYPTLVENIYISPGSVVETLDNEFARIAADVIYEVASLARDLNADTQWVDMEGNAGLVLTSQPTDTVEESGLAPGLLDYSKVGTATANPWFELPAAGWYTPIDVSLLQRIRVMLYCPPGEQPTLPDVNFFLYNDAGNLNGGVWLTAIHAGWNLFVLDLDSNTSPFGTWDREGDVHNIVVQPRFTSSAVVTTEPLSLYYISSTPADGRV